jgi:DNA-binding GntR family transcriptional regulator
MVANHIREMIELRQVKPGDPVPLEVIEEALSVSRTPTREAIRQLELENLVEIRSGKRAFFPTISTEEIEDLYRFRRHIEVQATRKAAGRISRYDLEILKDNLENYSINIEKPSRLSKLDRQFHNTIYEASGNRYFEKVLKSLRIRMGLLKRPAYGSETRIRQTISEHQTILNALIERDGPKAEEAARLHVNNSWNERMMNVHK